MLNLITIILASHHHFTEFIKVHGSRAILIKFLNDSIQFLISEGSEQFPDQRSQGVIGDEALALLVVDPECVLELLLHGLKVWVLDQEGGAQLTELWELDLSRAVLVNLQDKVLQLLLGGSEAHGPHDLAQVIGRQEVLLLGVEQVKAHLPIMILETKIR